MSIGRRCSSTATLSLSPAVRADRRRNRRELAESDLHAFRASLCTHLARAGIPLRTVQPVMRHSDPSLTANIYTDPTLLDTAAAVASLPALGVVVVSTKSGSA